MELTDEELQELIDLEREFDAVGGRGVELAERIDYLTAKRDWDGSLACPNCGSTELATMEELLGTAALTLLTADEMEWEGYTEVNWDSSESTGIECQSCYWNNRDADDLREGLVPSWTVTPKD